MANEQVLKNEVKFAFAYQDNKQISYLSATVLTEPEVMRFPVIEKECPVGHKVKLISLFTSNEKSCLKHGVEYREGTIPHADIEYYTFTAQTLTDNNRIEVFYEKHESIPKFIIYDKIDIRGYDISVKTRNKAVYGKGVVVIEMTITRNDIDNQVSMLKADQVIDLLISDKPRLSYDDDIINTYKHAMLLPLTATGINIACIGEVSTIKTILGYQLKDISNGAYADMSKTSKVGLIGGISMNLKGQSVFYGGAIFSARNSVLICDEIDKIDRFDGLHALNEILANQRFNYRKASVKYDSEFKMSLIAFGNPSPSAGNFKSVPKYEIDKLFANNRDFQSRLHLTFALKRKGFKFNFDNLSGNNSDNTLEQENIVKPIKIYINQAKKIQLKKELNPEVKTRIKSIIEERTDKTKDLRFHKKFMDLLQAEAKFQLHKEITNQDIDSILHIYDIQEKLLLN